MNTTTVYGHCQQVCKTACCCCNMSFVDFKPTEITGNNVFLIVLIDIDELLSGTAKYESTP